MYKLFTFVETKKLLYNNNSIGQKKCGHVWSASSQYYNIYIYIYIKNNMSHVHSLLPSTKAKDRN